MPVIHIHGTGEAYETNLTTSILNALLKHSFPIQTVCGGRASCGRDLIRVKAGAEFMSPLRERERLKLAALARDGEPFGPDIRLACQSYVRGEVEIEVIHVVDRAGR